MKLAYDLALAYPYDPSLDYRLCAVIVRGGRVLSTGYNQRTCNGLTQRYRVTDHCCTTHAEVDAIVSRRKKIRFEGAKIYIVRLRHDGSVGNAKPCAMCHRILYNYGIRKAFFTTTEFPCVDSMRIKSPISDGPYSISETEGN